VLGAFAIIAGPGEASLLWWPALLLAAGAAGVVGGLAAGRDDALAGGGIVLAVGVAVTVGRFAGTWDAGVLALVSGAAALALLALGWRAAGLLDGEPRWPGAALLVASFPLAVVALANLADTLGGSTGSDGSVTWVALALTVVYGAAAVLRRSAACALLAAQAGVVALVAGASWLFDPEDPAPFRWLLVAAVAALGIGVVRLRDRRPLHASALAVAAGLTALSLAGLLYTILLTEIFAAFGAGEPEDVPGIAWGWELFLLIAGLALVGFGARWRQPGAAWIGVAVLFSFVLLATVTSIGELEGASVLWWPALLIAAGLAAIAAGLRPSDPGDGVPVPAPEPQPVGSGSAFAPPEPR
jgi:hypothetical protein